jgi:hypothetical protein
LSPHRQPILLALLVVTGCAIGPRFPPDVATSFARDQMRRLETRSLVVYYPAQARDAALATAARIESCAATLRRAAKSPTERDKLVVLVTSAEFNNAFVRARVAGMPAEMVVPVQMGAELFNFFDFGVGNIPDIACHESVHYVHLEQIDGLWRFLNLVFGDLASPNVSTERWFIEGLATWFEGRLGHESGRPHSPLWEAMFASGIASQGWSLHAGQLSPTHRMLFPFGGEYLAGSQFVGWLARTHGEDKLWELVRRQGRSIFFPFGVTLRFRAVYGKTIGGLLDDYNRELRANRVVRERPPSQHVLTANAGHFARLASAPDGSLALVSIGLDRETHLEVFESDGRLRFSRRLRSIFPFREWIAPHPASISGLGFTADGRSLFLFAQDVGIDTASTYAVRQFDARSGDHVRTWQGVRGLGGDVSPDGKSYVFIGIENDVANLARLDLSTGRVAPLTAFTSRESLGGVAISPDGRRVAFSRRTQEGFDLHLREEDGSLRALTSDGRFNYGVQWASSDELVFMREREGRSQAHALSMISGELRAITDVPYALMDPAPLPDGRIAFLNRDGWGWTVDVGGGPAERWAAASTSRERAAVLADVAGDASPNPPDAAASSAVRGSASGLEVLKDERYSGFDELFIPRLRGPFVALTGSTVARVVPGAGMSGFDRLGLHTWSIDLAYDTFSRKPSVWAGYGNSQLAPWFLSLEAARLADRSITSSGAEIELTDVRASVGARRPFWTSELSLGIEALWRDARATAPPAPAVERSVRLVGPRAAFGWFAGDGTWYAGTRRGLSLDVSAALYPRVASSFDLADLSMELGVWLPVPILERSTFAISLRGRAVPGPVGGLLQVGGVSDAVWMGPGDAEAGELPPRVFLPRIAFAQPLRGFDDVAFRANAVGIVGARFRYPFIIDGGTTTFLWLLPSFFIRQLEAEIFFEGARTDLSFATPSLLDPVGLHAAAGGTARLRMLWGSAAPVTLYYQYAYRFDPALRPLHSVGIQLE